MRDETLREAKSILRGWFRSQDDAYLTRVVDECRAGTFAMWRSCRCVRGLCDGGYGGVTATSELALAAEVALVRIGGDSATGVICPGKPGQRFATPFGVFAYDGEELRRARVLPIVLAEIRRRTRAARQAEHVTLAAPLK